MRAIAPLRSAHVTSQTLSGTVLPLGGNTESRGGRVVEDDVLALEEDVAVDGEADAGVGLDATVAGAAARGDGGVVDVGAGNDGAVAADAECQAGEGGGAGEDVAAVGGRVLRARNLSVVRADEGGGGVDEGGAGVSDGVDGGRDEAAGAHGVAGTGELPEAVGGVDRHVGDGAGVLRGVEEAEVVGAWSALLQVDSDNRRRKRGLDVVEEGLLGRRADGVDGRERKAEQAVVVDVLGEFGADGGGSLNSLARNGGAADGDRVGVDDTRRAAAISVLDPPRVAAQLLGRGARGVDAVSRPLRCGKSAGENPAVQC